MSIQLLKTLPLAFLIPFIFFLIPLASIAQQNGEVDDDQVEEAEPDTVSYWNMNWVAGINGSQAAYTNWSKGGVNSLSISSSSLIRLVYDRGNFNYEFRVRNRYGKTRIQDQGVRKTDDQIAIRNRFLFDISPDEDNDFRLFGNIDFDTQFTEGYNYQAGPEGQDILISDFLSPAYFSQNTGLAYFPQANFSIEAGMGLRQTVVRDTTLSLRYGLNEGQTFKNQGGFTLGLNFDWEMMENIDYICSIETFTSIRRPVRRTDIFFSNELIGKVNDHVNVTFRLDMIYDDDFSNRLQFRQALSAGVSIDLQ
jgi:hypothetical protein